MLDALRKRAGGWVAQLFIALLVVSFAVWGVSDIFTGFRADTVATVGRTDVDAQQFYRQYETAKRRVSQQVGRQITDEQARLLGIPGQVLGRLLTEATLSDQAATLGLGVSGETMATQIADDPMFQGPSGTFDRGRFLDVITSNGMNEDQFVEELEQGYVRQQLVSALAGGIEVPDVYLRAFYEFENEQRDISYVVLQPAMAGAIAEPTDTDLNAFFEENKSRWRAPEVRSARVMRMMPEDLANTGEITDEAARESYDVQVATRFTAPERRQIEQIVFANMAEASEAASALADGKTFDELIADRGLKPEDVDLGLITRGEVIDPKVAEAAFALEANSVSGIIEGNFGPVIVRVTTVEPELVTPFEDVKEIIKKEMAEARAVDEIADQLDVIEDARAGGSTLEEVAANYDLKLVTYPTIDATGKDIDGETIADLPGGQELVAAIFQSDVGLENNPLRVGNGFVWYEVTEVSPARDRELSEVREKVVEAYKASEVGKKLDEIATEIRDRLAASGAIDDIADEKSLTVETATALKRSTDPTDALTVQAIQAAFGGPEGFATVADGTDQAKVVLIVTKTTIPPFFADAPDNAESNERLADAISNDYLRDYVGQLQERLGVAVNQAALSQLIGITTPGS